MRTDELRTGLAERAATLPEHTDVRERLAGVDRRVAGLRRRRQAGRSVAVVAAAAAVVGAVVVGGPRLAGTDVPGPVSPSSRQDTPRPDPEPPGEMAGYALPATVTVNDVAYEYGRSEVGVAGERVHRMAVAPDRQPQAIAWATTPGTTGQVVVSVDGNEVSRSSAGAIETGTLLSSGRGHLVVVRLTHPSPTSRIGVAVYHWPRP